MMNSFWTEQFLNSFLNTLAYDTVTPVQFITLREAFRVCILMVGGVPIVLIYSSSPLYILYVLCIVNKQ